SKNQTAILFSNWGSLTLIGQLYFTDVRVLFILSTILLANHLHSLQRLPVVAELEENNYHLRDALQTEIENNHLNEKWFNQLKCEYKQEIQNLNKEIAELRSEISSLKSQLYQAKKDVRDKE
ncbi:16737_t:CDS:2, partial [Funneliformis geosporum]